MILCMLYLFDNVQSKMYIFIVDNFFSFYKKFNQLLYDTIENRFEQGSVISISDLNTARLLVYVSLYLHHTIKANQKSHTAHGAIK